VPAGQSGALKCSCLQGDRLRRVDARAETQPVSSLGRRVIGHPVPGAAEKAGVRVGDLAASPTKECCATFCARYGVPTACGRSTCAAILSADPWPDDMPVPSFGLRMVCTRSGIIGADARPNWREQPARESLTGAQWR
jgi:hypothetical protein